MRNRFDLKLALSIAALLGMLLVLPGGMFRGNPIDKLTVVSWTPPNTCDAENGERWEAQFSGPIRRTSEGWQPVVLGGTVTPETGNCVAYSRGLHLRWRACCINEVGKACAVAEPGELHQPCSQIYQVNGVPFRADHVLRWNEDHVTPATPTPTP
jgi:hypothetical protein